MQDPLLNIDWSKIPPPIDDGATQHLIGQKMPDITLDSTDGHRVNLSRLKGKTIIYAYPRTGSPDTPTPEGWDAIPGARGCTPQSCAFRDHFAELKMLGVTHLFGLSSQDTLYQQAAVKRLHLPFPLLSDHELKLTRALALPTFEAAGMTLLKRFTLVLEDDRIAHVFYPIFPPDQHAVEVLEWLARASANLDKKRNNP